MSAVYKDAQEDWLMVCLKYLLFVFNFLFWVGGAAVLGVGVWTLVEKSDYLSLLASSTFAVSAYILILAGSLVVVTGFLGCCAVIREQRSCLSMYFFCLLVIFLIELVAGVLAYVYYQRLSEELKQHLNQTMTDNYAQPGKEAITLAVDRLQQDFKCCGSNTSHDWMGGCITKLEQFLADHLLVIGAVGIGVACLQICGMVFTSCLYKRIKMDPY
ncbi:tetraspanin-11 isoform X5 [Micropterus dolomieu]|uniref:tetraspanin-11 isoform X5 n=1 Tax=Micropterus dolomieu TaxID=147949 RepID=UPI001E8D8DE2|nr:tetraspanin-11 isoform X5 [Micropterus dolomieu]